MQVCWIVTWLTLAQLNDAETTDKCPAFNKQSHGIFTKQMSQGWKVVIPVIH